MVVSCCPVITCFIVDTHPIHGTTSDPFRKYFLIRFPFSVILGMFPAQPTMVNSASTGGFYLNDINRLN